MHKPQSTRDELLFSGYAVLPWPGKDAGYRLTKPSGAPPVFSDHEAVLWRLAGEDWKMALIVKDMNR